MRHSAEISPKNSNHPLDPFISPQFSNSHQRRTLEHSQNSSSRLKQAKFKSNEKSSKNIKITPKLSLCDSKSASRLILTSKKKPPLGIKLKGKLKNIKDKLGKSDLCQDQIDKKAENRIENFVRNEEYESKYAGENDEKAHQVSSLPARNKHKKSLSLNFDCNNSNNKDLIDTNQYIKPLNTAKGAKIKSKKLNFDLNKSAKNGSQNFLRKQKNSSTEVHLKHLEDNTVKKKEIKTKKSLGSSNSKADKVVNSKTNQRSFLTGSKDSRQLKGIIKASKYPETTKNFPKSFNTENKSLDSSKSSFIPTETDEWVNFLDYKFVGSASGFVEEFKAKILEDFPIPTNHDEFNDCKIHTRLSTYENLDTEDLNLSLSESLLLENPTMDLVEVKNVKIQQYCIPKLALNDIIGNESPSFLYNSLSEANCTSEIPENVSEKSCFDSEKTKNDQIFYNKFK